MLKFNVSSREHISYLTIGTHIGYLEGHVKSGWFLNDIYPQIEGVGFFLLFGPLYMLIESTLNFEIIFHG